MGCFERSAVDRSLLRRRGKQTRNHPNKNASTFKTENKRTARLPLLPCLLWARLPLCRRSLKEVAEQKHRERLLLRHFVTPEFLENNQLDTALPSAILPEKKWSRCGSCSF